MNLASKEENRDSSESGTEAGERDTLLSNMEARVEHQTTRRFNLLYGVSTGLGAVLFFLVLYWCIHCREGFAWTSNPKLEFNWHPLLMTGGMVFLYGQSILIYRSARNFRKKNLKLVHGFLHLLVFILSVIALKAVFDSHNLKDPPIPNLYTLHSWIGLIAVILFTLQLVGGFVSFLYPGLPMDLRAAVLPVHVHFGSSIFIMAVAAALMGFLEKAIFELGNDYKNLQFEGVLINIMGLLLIGFALMVLYLVSDSTYKRQSIPEDNINLVNESQRE